MCGHRAAAAVLVSWLLASAFVAAAEMAASGQPTAGAADTGVIPLPVPVRGVRPLPGIGLTPELLLPSVTPGPVSDRETVTVSVGPSGAPASVVDQQRLGRHGDGKLPVHSAGGQSDDQRLQHNAHR